MSIGSSTQSRPLSARHRRRGAEQTVGRGALASPNAGKKSLRPLAKFAGLVPLWRTMPDMGPGTAIGGSQAKNAATQECSSSTAAGGPSPKPAPDWTVVRLQVLSEQTPGDASTGLRRRFQRDRSAMGRLKKTAQRSPRLLRDRRSSAAAANALRARDIGADQPSWPSIFRVRVSPPRLSRLRLVDHQPRHAEATVREVSEGRETALRNSRWIGRKCQILNSILLGFYLIRLQRFQSVETLKHLDCIVMQWPQGCSHIDTRHPCSPSLRRGSQPITVESPLKGTVLKWPQHFPGDINATNNGGGFAR